MTHAAAVHQSRPAHRFGRFELQPAERRLLVLDNCEHLTDAVAAFVEAARAVAPRVRYLATSQETLKTPEEHICHVGGLAVPADKDATDAMQAGAIELFVARAEGPEPNLGLTPPNASAVIEIAICRRLDGIPLAIELARLPAKGAAMRDELVFNLGFGEGA